MEIPSYNDEGITYTESDYYKINNRSMSFNDNKTIIRGRNDPNFRYSTRERTMSAWDPQKKRSENNSFRLAREQSLHDNNYHYSPSRLKLEINEKFHEDYKTQMAELETYKYNYAMLNETHQMTIITLKLKVENIEKENKSLTNKYQIVKNHYTILKDHYHANKSALQNLQNESLQHTKQIENLEKELNECQYEKKAIKQEHHLIRKILDEEKRNFQQENQYFAETERRLKSQIEQYKKESLEKSQQLQEFQEMFQTKLQEQVRNNEQISKEKARNIEYYAKIQDQLAESLENSAKLKEEIAQDQLVIKNLQVENEGLREEVKHLKTQNKENLEKKNQLQELQNKETRLDRELLESQTKELTQLRNEKEYLAKALDSIQEELLDSKTLLQEERKRTEKEIEKLNKVITENKEVYQKEIENLVSKVMELNNEKCQLLNDNNKTKFDFNYLESQMPEFQEKIYKLESQNEKLKKELELTKLNPLKTLSTNSRSEYEINQETAVQKIQNKSYVGKSIEFDTLFDGSKLKTENNEQKNQLSYSNSSSELSEMLTLAESRCGRNEQEKAISTKKGYDKENEPEESTKPTLKSERESFNKEPLINKSLTARDYTESKKEYKEDQKAYEDHSIKSSRSDINYDLQRLENKYKELKLKYKY